MSFQIDWTQLADTELAASVLNYLNDYFSRVERPSFIGPISMLEFDFGDVPPEVEIVDLTEPLPEFYAMEAEDSHSEDASRSYSAGEGVSEIWISNELSSEDLASSGYLNSRRPPRGPGSAGFDSASVLTGGTRRWLSEMARDRQSIRSGFDHSEEARTEVQSNNEMELPRGEMDVQLEVAVRYKGNMLLKIATELIINQPTENFMALPITLTVTALSLSAVAIVAYLSDRIIFCLKPQTPPDQFLQDFSIDSEIGDGNRQVLKNVGKIERFIVDQLRKVASLITFPSYSVFELFMPDPEELSEADDVEID